MKAKEPEVLRDQPPDAPLQSAPLCIRHSGGYVFPGNNQRRTLFFRSLPKLLPVAMALITGLHAHAQSDLLTYTGVWTTVPVTGLSVPTGVTGDSAGNLYISDSSLSSIVKIAADGTQSTVGSGLSSPGGLAMDSAGNLRVASTGDNSVYKITAAGVQTTIGSGWSSPIGVAVDSSGNVFVIDGSGLSEVTTGGAQSLLVSGASLRGLTVDTNGDVFYGDDSVNTVYEIPFGSTSTLVASSNYISGLFVDAQGSLYMARTDVGAQRLDDISNDRTTFGDTAVTKAVWGDTQNLYLVDSSGTIEKLALGAVEFGRVNLCNSGNTAGPCTSTRTLHFALDTDISADPAAVAVAQGVPDLDYTFTPDGCSGTLTFGASCSLTVTFTPTRVGDRLGAALNIGPSTANSVARPVGPHPQIRSSQAPHPLDEPPGTMLSSVPLHGVGVAPIGAFSTAPIESFPLNSFSGGFLYGVTLGSDNFIYTTDSSNCVVQAQFGNNAFTIAGTTCGVPSGDGGPADMATMTTPTRTVIDGAGNLFISDANGQNVRRVDRNTGIITTAAGTGAFGYSGDGGPATSATLSNPSALAIDATGSLYIADSSNNVVRKVDALTGIITTIAGNGTTGYTGDGGAATSAQLDGPDALAFDSAGTLYIADDNNSAIRKVAAGIITTIAGNGTYGYSGDGGLGTSAQLADPEGLSVDPAGSVYIADSGNRLVRKVDATTGIITTVAGTFVGNTMADDRYTGDGGPAIQAGLSYDEDVFVDAYGEVIIADSDNSVIRYAIEPVGLANFGTVAIGFSSAPQDVTFSNVGNAPLSVRALQVPPNYNLSGTDTTCTSTTTLAPTAGCVFSVQLTPIADGSLNTVVVIEDDFYNDLQNGQIIAVQGTGTGAVPAQLAFAAPIPTIVTGGNPGTVVVNVQASDNSLITVSTAAVTLTVTGPGGFSQTFTATAVNGVATFNLTSLTLTTTGVYTFTATSGSLTPAQDNVTVIVNTPGPAQLAIPPSIPTSIPVGSSPGIIPVDIENSAAMVVTGANNPVTLTITGPGGYSQVVTVAATNGIASFDLSALVLTTPGVYTLTATSDELASTFATITVGTGTAPAPVKLAIGGNLPAIIASGANLGVLPVELTSASGVLSSTATNTVTLTITGPNGFSHVLTVAAVNGVANFNLTSLGLTATGSYTITATSPGLTQAQVTVTVTIGAVSTTPVQLSIPPTVPATIASGDDLGTVPVNIDNSSGTVIPGASNTVTLTITGPGGFSYTATVTAVNGVANFDLSSVALTAPGTYTLTATSGRLSQALATVTVSTDFTIAVTSSTQATIGPILPGSSALFSFTLAPASGTFPAAITLSAAGMPVGATYSFAPATVTPGSNAVKTALAIKTPGIASAAVRPQPRTWWGFGTVALGLLLLPLSGSRRMRTAFRRTSLLSAALLLLALGSVAGLAGCGAGGLFGHPQGSYIVTVTGTSGSVSHSATVTLSIQ